MNREVRQISDDGSIVRITVFNERWYMKTLENGEIKEYPSVTWIGGYCPKGIGYYKWLAQNGWNDAETIKEERGNEGYKVHKGIESLLLGNKIGIDDTLPNADGEQEKITLSEYEAIMSFAEWHREVKPETIDSEIVVFNDELMYAGTVDFVCKIDGKVTIVDFKISNDVYDSHRAQVSAYKPAYEQLSGNKVDNLAILQLNYKRNKTKKWKYNEVEYDLDLFLAAKKFWQQECANVKIQQKDYPTSISL